MSKTRQSWMPKLRAETFRDRREQFVRARRGWDEEEIQAELEQDRARYAAWDEETGLYAEPDRPETD